MRISYSQYLTKTRITLFDYYFQIKQIIEKKILIKGHFRRINIKQGKETADEILEKKKKNFLNNISDLENEDGFYIKIK